jgi:predicted ATPase
VAHCSDAIAYAEKLGHPHSISFVLSFLAGAYLLAGNPRVAFPVAERTIAYSNEYGFPQWSAGGLMVRGWARADLGEIEAGLTDIRNSIRGLETTGTLIWMQFAHYLLARVLVAQGRFQEASEIVNRILAEIETTGGRWYEADIHRLKGDIFTHEGRTVSEIESCYQIATAIVRRQDSQILDLMARKSERADVSPQPS